MMVSGLGIQVRWDGSGRSDGIAGTRKAHPPQALLFLAQVIAALVIFSCLSGSSKLAIAQQQAPVLRQVSCWFEAPTARTVKCYRLRVPERRTVDRPTVQGDAGGAAGRPVAGKVGGEAGAGRLPAPVMPAPVMPDPVMLDLPVAVISSPKDRRHDDPVIYISGGPGDGDWLDADRIGYWWDFLTANPWLRHRDLILFDQRGVGMTEPRIDCPELEALELPSLAFGNDHKGALEQSRKATQACLARVIAEGHDPAAYTTEASAEDLHDLFAGLGIPHWNIYGLSYGTRLALTYMRLHPDDIRTAILDSVYPPAVHFLEDDAAHTDRAFRLIFDACAADPACRRWYPDLAQRLQALVDRLNRTPLQTHHADPDGGPELQFPLTGETLLMHLFFNLYNRDDIERVPQIIDIFDRNLAGPIGKEVDLLVAELHDRPNWGDAMALTIDCLEDLPFNDPAKVQANYAASRLLHSFADADPAANCPAWIKASPVATMAQPVDSALPGLVFAGSNDPVTPPDYAQLAARHLAHGFYVEFPAIGHDVLGNSVCAGRVAEAFLSTPDQPPADPCQKVPRPLVFAPPIAH
ncbi:MAG TPA: alpha/beta fold hydrolase [Dongiaceae bacterium]|nr:alpha/beta fold hydrolase [Dongiaceae bacterium]